MSLPRGIRAVLLDIEGTTTPIAFVYDVLFPFARRGLEQACARADRDERIAEALGLLRLEHAREHAHAGAFGTGAEFAERLMEQDLKSTGLKALQGVIWEQGYRSGELRAQVFDDVPVALAAWREAGIRLRIFSSGSVLAQKLLFGHTDHGDLLGYFEGFHDTTTGPKKVADSYAAIAREFGLPSGEILFLSDVVAELDAARQAGMATGLLLRPGNKPVAGGAHIVYRDFLPLL